MEQLETCPHKYEIHSVEPKNEIVCEQAFVFNVRGGVGSVSILALELQLKLVFTFFSHCLKRIIFK